MGNYKNTYNALLLGLGKPSWQSWFYLESNVSSLDIRLFKYYALDFRIQTHNLEVSGSNPFLTDEYALFARGNVESQLKIIFRSFVP